ncbi:hypothetical protein DAPPUDRAFT_123965, partial [Daphnia pulex]
MPLDHKKLEVAELFKELLENQTKQSKLFGSSREFIKTKVCSYSQEFIERLKKYGKTELNEDLNITNWVEEYCLVIADLRLYQVSTTGNAQCGKTLFNTLLLVDFTTFSNLDTIWFYPTKTQLDSLVPNMFGRVSKHYLTNLEKQLNIENLKSTKGNNYNQRIRDASIYFRFASTSAKDNTEQKKGLTAVGGSAASISGNMLFIEERSQISPDSLSTLYRRLDAARFPNGLIREIGTPGGGLGIESNIDRADYHFYPHTICDSCNKEIALNPKGALFHKQPDGIHLKELLKRLPTEEDQIFTQQLNVIVHLSPLLRQSKQNLAVKLVDIGENGDNPRDFQQQVLGWKSENDQ